MVDITEKNNTLRIATAQAILKVGSSETIEAIKNRTVPKGDVFEMSRAAGLLGIKNTPLILPDCHPLPIESTKVFYEIEGLTVIIKMEVKTIYKTGVEVEAMHGVSVIALNMYDMLKPIDKNVSIEHIKLLSKTGGKSDFKYQTDYKIKIITCSDTASVDPSKDTSGPLLKEFLNFKKLDNVEIEIISDEIADIQNQLLINNDKDWLIFCGGTGIGDRDNTCELVSSVLDKRLFGVEEKMRSFGQDRNPKAMFSRSVAGTRGKQLIMAIPGSKNGALESIKSIFPHILHTFDVLKGTQHEELSR